MKKVGKIVLCIVITLAVIAAAGVATFKLYIEPKYMGTVIEKAQEVVNNDKLNDSVSSLVQKLDEEGVLDEKTKVLYEQTFGAMNDADVSEILDSEEVNDYIENKSDGNDNSATSSDSNDKTDNGDTKNTDNGKKDTQASQNNDAKSDTDKKTEDKSEATQKPSEPKATSKPSSDNNASSDKDSSSNDSVQERIKKASSPEEYAEGMKILSKVDLGTAKNLYQTDQNALMDYLQERLSSNEINEALQLYMKYKDLL